MVEALELRLASPGGALARGVQAFRALLYNWDARAALEGFDRSLELDPTSIPVRAWYTWALLAGDRSPDAVEQARRIVQLDPQSPYANAMAGLTHLMADRVEEALRLERRAVDLYRRLLGGRGEGTSA